VSFPLPSLAIPAPPLIAPEAVSLPPVTVIPDSDTVPAVT
jgi:hypothetical protein